MIREGELAVGGQKAVLSIVRDHLPDGTTVVGRRQAYFVERTIEYFYLQEF
jgi:hypothetical protein